MPVYEYECDTCRKVLEAQQRIADAPLTVCSRCGGHLRKLISRSSFQLKGSGWYSDGYSCKSDNCSCASESKAAASPCASESKAAASPCAGASSCCNHCPAST